MIRTPFAAAAVTIALLVASTALDARRQAPTAAEATPDAVYMCPMHPDVRGAPGEKCPRCAMDLVPASAADYRPYLVDFDVAPRALHVGEHGRVRFAIHNPRTGAPIVRFEQVHERIFHLFIVSQDLQYFVHVHPTLRPNGALELDVTLPRPGLYQFIGDFLPSGGAPQLTQRAVVTAGFTGLLNAVPELIEDTGDKIDADTRVKLSMSPLRAGREQLITLELSDTQTEVPITDLEPYLGATGHLFAASADLSAVFHSHPVAGVSSGSGPTIVFQVMMPRPGRYRLWAQFQRHGRVSTVVFTVPVAG